MTGAGAAVARMLAQCGVKVAINYSSNRVRAAETLGSLAGSGHILIQGDVFDRAGIAKIASSTTQQLGGLDLVVSNAGWTAFGTFDDLGEWYYSRTPHPLPAAFLSQLFSSPLAAFWVILAVRDSIPIVNPVAGLRS
jgi:NAD(P)-dependent dehydrogenase (short-subunit alcohol dehydrogenase family)